MPEQSPGARQKFPGSGHHHERALVSDDSTTLLLAARDGDRHALAAFVRATQGDVWRLCAHLVDRQSADDLAQETYLRALRALGRFRGDAGARTWLLVIARRVCADALRARGRQRRLTRALEARDAAPVPSPTGLVELDLLLAGLDPDRRAAFVLTQVLGLPYEAAAAVCGVPIGTIRSRVARARQQLTAAVSLEAAAPTGRPSARSS